MYRFQHIEYLWLLILVPVATVFYIIYLKWRKARIAQLGAYDLVKDQLAGRISGRLTTKFVLVIIAFICAVLGLANLQKGAGTETAERKGIDVIFALDVSKSMLAKDIQPNRLTRSKQLIERMMGKMKNDRVGLVVFAGRAYLQTPLTVDYSAVKMLLSSVGPDMVPTQGTVLSEAIDLANRSFSEKEKKYKALVLISDGEDHDEEAEAMAKQAAEQGVIIHTVGVGSPEGATITDPVTGKEKLDEEGKPVITKLNEAELQGIAQAGGGGYQHLNNANAVADNLSDAINNIEGRNMGAVIFTQYQSYFQYFIAIAVLLLIVEWMIPSSRTANRRRTVVVKAGVILLILLSPVSGFSQQKDAVKATAAANDQIYKGNKLYRDKKYKEANDAYNEALKYDPNSVKGKYNSGDALYNSEQYDKAGEQFAFVAGNSKDKAEKARANHNLGNSFMKQQKWQEAVDALKQSLKLNPTDEDTRYNLAYAQEKLKQQNKNNKNNKDKNKQDKKDNKENKNNKDKNKDDKGDDKPKDDKGGKDKKNDKGEQDKKDDKGDQPPQQPQSMPSKLSEKQAENLLNALRQEEKKLQDKKNKERGVPVKLQKDW